MLTRKKTHLGLSVVITLCMIAGCSWFNKPSIDSGEGDDPSWNYYEMSDDRAEKLEKEEDGSVFDFLRQGTQGSGVTPEGRDIERRLGYR